MLYPIILEPDGPGWMASFPDIPEALTGGDTREEALANAHEALVTAFEFYVEDQRPVPLPSNIDDAPRVAVPLSVWSKVLLLNTLLEQQVSQVELARAMAVLGKQLTLAAR